MCKNTFKGKILKVNVTSNTVSVGIKGNKNRIDAEWPTIRKEVTTEAAFNRLTYTVCILILLLCAILHYTVNN